MATGSILELMEQTLNDKRKGDYTQVRKVLGKAHLEIQKTFGRQFWPMFRELMSYTQEDKNLLALQINQFPDVTSLVEDQCLTEASLEFTPEFEKVSLGRRLNNTSDLYNQKFNSINERVRKLLSSLPPGQDDPNIDKLRDSKSRDSDLGKVKMDFHRDYHKVGGRIGDNTCSDADMADFEKRTSDNCDPVLKIYEEMVLKFELDFASDSKVEPISIPNSKVKPRIQGETRKMFSEIMIKILTTIKDKYLCESMEPKPVTKVDGDYKFHWPTIDDMSDYCMDKFENDSDFNELKLQYPEIIAKWSHYFRTNVSKVLPNKIQTSKGKVDECITYYGYDQYVVNL